MSQTTFKLDLGQAAEAPPLPDGTIRFVMYCLSSFKGWIVLMLFLSWCKRLEIS